MKKQLTLKEQLVWQGVGFVIGAILFVAVGGLSGCTTVPARADCAHAHNRWMEEAAANELCHEAVDCFVTPTDIKREDQAHAEMMVACNIQENAK